MKVLSLQNRCVLLIFQHFSRKNTLAWEFSKCNFSVKCFVTENEIVEYFGCNTFASCLQHRLGFQWRASSRLGHSCLDIYLKCLDIHFTCLDVHVSRVWIYISGYNIYVPQGFGYLSQVFIYIHLRLYIYLRYLDIYLKCLDIYLKCLNIKLKFLDIYLRCLDIYISIAFICHQRH